jgi:hypothetical protein
LIQVRSLLARQAGGVDHVSHFFHVGQHFALAPYAFDQCRAMGWTLVVIADGFAVRQRMAAAGFGKTGNQRLGFGGEEHNLDIMALLLEPRISAGSSASDNALRASIATASAVAPSFCRWSRPARAAASAGNCLHKSSRHLREHARPIDLPEPEMPVRSMMRIVR